MNWLRWMKFPHMGFLWSIGLYDSTNVFQVKFLVQLYQPEMTISLADLFEIYQLTNYSYAYFFGRRAGTPIREMQKLPVSWSYPILLRIGHGSTSVHEKGLPGLSQPCFNLENFIGFPKSWAFSVWKYHPHLSRYHNEMVFLKFLDWFNLLFNW